MAIILEGFDNSGKSTLAKSFNLPVLHPGPRPQTFEEILDCLDDQRRRSKFPVIMDRVTCISQVAYGGEDSRLMQNYRKHMWKIPNVIVYCRPPIDKIMDFKNHQVKAYDTPEALETLKLQARGTIARYDDIMATIPHIKYDYTKEDNSMFIQTLKESQFTLEGWKYARSRCRQ